MMKSDKATYIIFMSVGILFGLLFPLTLVSLDLIELKMGISSKNILWVIHSQNAIAVSAYGFPVIFGVIGFLFALTLIKKKEIEAANKEISRMSHAAGMAEIASEVIHNIGNVLTSVFIYVDMIIGIKDKSQYKTALQGKEMLESKVDLLAEIGEKDPEAKKLIEFYGAYSEKMAGEYDQIGEYVIELKQKIFTIRDILMTQQSYANAGAFVEDCSVVDLIENALKIMSGKIKVKEILLEKNYAPTPKISTETSKVVNILTNLIKNATEAMAQSETRKLEISTSLEKGSIEVRIKDTGEGIGQENLKTIFNYGFTTKKFGKGMGLHSCANLARTMGGDLRVESEGIGKGATFIVVLPAG